MSPDPIEDMEAELDVRSVAVIWTDEEEPEIDLTGCSRFEAIGLLLHGLAELLFPVEFTPDDE